MMDRLITFGSLFAGIGGFDLGFERAGMVCRWQVEIDPFCQRQLCRLFPDVGRWDDVRTFPPSAPPHEWRVDVICGGFPCQDISVANPSGLGIDGPRSGLWREYHRIIRTLRPRIVVVENVPNLLGRGIRRVLGDLAASGYDAEWDVLPASAFGAHFPGQRVFIVAANSPPSCLRREGRWTKPKAIECPWGREEFEGLLRSVVQSAVPAGKRGALSDGFPSKVDWLRVFGNSVTPQQSEWIGRRVVRFLNSHGIPEE